MDEGRRPHGEKEGDWGEEREDWDELSGKKLDPVKVKAARKEELKFIDSKPLYDVVDETEAWAHTGRSPISTRWADINKGGDDGHRSRFVARGFKDSKADDFYASTPPWELVKFLISIMASQGGRSDGGDGGVRPGKGEEREKKRRSKAVG